MPHTRRADLGLSVRQVLKTNFQIAFSDSTLYLTWVLLLFNDIFKAMHVGFFQSVYKVISRYYPAAKLVSLVKNKRVVKPRILVALT